MANAASLIVQDVDAKRGRRAFVAPHREHPPSEAALAQIRDQHHGEGQNDHGHHGEPRGVMDRIKLKPKMLSDPIVVPLMPPR